jgi:hypothetical protein
VALSNQNLQVDQQTLANQLCRCTLVPWLPSGAARDVKCSLRRSLQGTVPLWRNAPLPTWFQDQIDGWVVRDLTKKIKHNKKSQSEINMPSAQHNISSAHHNFTEQ